MVHIEHGTIVYYFKTFLKFLLGIIKVCICVLLTNNVARYEADVCVRGLQVDSSCYKRNSHHLKRTQRYYSSSDNNIVQWHLSWETTTITDHLSWRTTGFRQKVTHFNVNEPVNKDHLPQETIILWPMGWSFKTGFTVSLFIHIVQFKFYSKT